MADYRKKYDIDYGKTFTRCYECNIVYPHGYMGKHLLTKKHADYCETIKKFPFCREPRLCCDQ